MKVKNEKDKYPFNITITIENEADRDLLCGISGLNCTIPKNVNDETGAEAFLEKLRKSLQ